MYPWRRILVPTDFSTASEWVFDDAARLAESTAAEIVILHIRMTWKSTPSELRFPADPALYEYAERRELNLLESRVRSANASVTTRLVVKQAPDPGGEICRTAQAENADLIVIATHARHHVAHLLIGSTTRSVLTCSSSPILAIRYGIRKRRGMQRIVVPVHLKQVSQPALDLAAAVAARENAEIHLLTVCSDDQRPEAAALLDTLGGDRLAGVRIQKVIEKGEDIEREIVRYMEKSDADVVFLNARSELSTAKIDIIRHVPTPVMIVP